MTPVMNPKSASGLFFLAMILIFIGAVALDPGLRVFLFVSAAVSAALPVLLGGGRSRLPGLVVAVIAIYLAAQSYPAWRRHLKAYGGRVERKANAGAVETQRELSKDK
jgi:membrane protein implicated in regulation of membrane protease activity